MSKINCNLIVQKIHFPGKNSDGGVVWGSRLEGGGGGRGGGGGGKWGVGGGGVGLNPPLGWGDFTRTLVVLLANPRRFCLQKIPVPRTPTHNGHTLCHMCCTTENRDPWHNALETF
jgi:hypothetical protein